MLTAGRGQTKEGEEQRAYETALRTWGGGLLGLQQAGPAFEAKTHFPRGWKKDGTEKKASRACAVLKQSRGGRRLISSLTRLHSACWVPMVCT